MSCLFYKSNIHALQEKQRFDVVSCCYVLRVIVLFKLYYVCMYVVQYVCCAIENVTFHDQGENARNGETEFCIFSA